MLYKEEISRLIKSSDTCLSGINVYKFIKKSPNKKYGDLIFPCYDIANICNENPKKIAANLQNILVSDLFEKIESVGPYLNFYINKSSFIDETINEILNATGEEVVILNNKKENIKIISLVESEKLVEILKIYYSTFLCYVSRIYKGYYCDVHKDINVIENLYYVRDVAEYYKRKKLIIESNSSKIVPLKKFELPPLVVEKSNGEFSNDFVLLSEILYLIREKNVKRVILIVDHMTEEKCLKLNKACEVGNVDCFKKCSIVKKPIIKISNIALLAQSEKNGIIDSIKNLVIKLLIERQIYGKEYIEKNRNDINIKIMNSIKFYCLHNSSKDDFNFNIEDLISCNSGWYLQVIHIKLLKLISEINDYQEDGSNVSPRLESELALVEELAKNKQIIKKSMITLNPSLITNYSINLLKKFEKLYSELIEDGNNKKKRFFDKKKLLIATSKTLELIFNFLGFDLSQ